LQATIADRPTHNNETKSLTCTEYLTFMKHKAQKRRGTWRPKPKIVRTVDYNCAYVLIRAVLIIFPVILQTVINFIMLSTGRQGDPFCKQQFKTFFLLASLA